MGPLITYLIDAQDDKVDGWRVVLRQLSVVSLVVCVGGASLYKRPPAILAYVHTKPAVACDFWVNSERLLVIPGAVLRDCV